MTRELVPEVVVTYPDGSREIYRDVTLDRVVTERGDDPLGSRTVRYSIAILLNSQRVSDDAHT